MRDRIGRRSGIAGWLAVAGLMASCSTVGVISGTSRAPDGKTTPLTRQNGSLESLEAELASVKSDRVIVPTQLLRALVRNEKLVHRECNAVAGQLEALKNIDLEESAR